MTDTIEQRILSLEKHVAQHPKSPLFAQLASYYLDTGRHQEALSLCDKGLAQYPFYITGHLIKGKTLLALNMRAEARREFEIVHDNMPANEAVARLLAEIPPGLEETIAPPTTAVISEGGVRTIKPKAKAPAVAAEPPVAAPEPAPAPPSPPVSEAEQLLSQFTEPQAETAAPPPVIETPAETPGEISTASTEDPFGISAPSEPTETFSAAPEPQPDAFAAPEQAPPPEQPVDGGEPFDLFAQRMRMELIGTENTLSLDEYLHGNQSQPVASEPLPPPTESAPETTEDDPFAALRQIVTEEPPAQEPTQNDQIEEIAEKLKEAKRITPVINFSEKSTTPLSESDTPAGTGFVTPTLAEIYAKQGWFDDAIKAYRTLAANKPAEKDKFEQRIAELEELKKQQTQQ